MSGDLIDPPATALAGDVRRLLGQDCIAMHASTPLARHKSPETRYANRGIALDVRGSGAEALEPALTRAVLHRWPRHDFPTRVRGGPRR